MKHDNSMQVARLTLGEPRIIVITRPHKVRCIAAGDGPKGTSNFSVGAVYMSGRTMDWICQDNHSL